MPPRQLREIEISHRTIYCDSDGDRSLLAHAKAIVERRDAADGLSVGSLNQILTACRLYALGEAQHAVREAIAGRRAQEREGPASVGDEEE